MFDQKEIKSIEEEKIFKKRLKNRIYWVKSIQYSRYKSYKQGNVKSHIKYFKILNKYLNGHLPKLRLKNLNIGKEKFLIILSENIDGKKITLKQLKRYMDLPINKKLVNGIKLLLKKGYTLDFYNKDKNFIMDKQRKIFYTDNRMPLFSKKSNEGGRFDISKKITEEILK